MVRRQRHLRGAHQVEVVGLEPVDLAGVRAEEAGALHRLRLDQRRGDRRGEAVLDRLGDRHLQQAELQQRADAGEEVEPRARHLGAALGVDRPQRLADLEVVLRARRSAGRSPTSRSTTKSSSPPGGTPVLHDVGHGELGPAQRLVGRGRLGLGRLDLGGQLLGAGQQGGPLVRRTPWAPACSAISARRGPPRTAGWRRRRSSSARSRSSTTSVGSPRSRWLARISSGSSRSRRRSITIVEPTGGPVRSSPGYPRVGSARRVQAGLSRSSPCEVNGLAERDGQLERLVGGRLLVVAAAAAARTTPPSAHRGTDLSSTGRRAGAGRRGRARPSPHHPEQRTPQSPPVRDLICSASSCSV